MKKAEISFPRGKPPAVDSTTSGNSIKKKLKCSGDFRSKHINQDDDLFKVARGMSTDGLSKKKKKQKKLTSEETDVLMDSKENKTSHVIDVLSYETITEGMLSLGRIIKVREHEILVSLPGRTMGSVPITSISAPYTKALETLTADERSEDPLYGVSDLFRIGEVVSVAVVGVKREGHSVRVTLSMKPSDLQANYVNSAICESMVLTGAVASVEDHGYIIDVGISGTNAFLSKGNATAFIRQRNENRPLGIGQLLKCKVVTVKASGKSGASKAYVTLTANPKEVNHTRVTLETINNYQLLLPGMESEGTVMQTHKTGVKVDFLDLVGLIHLDHIVDSWTLPESLAIGATVFPRVLYTLPNSTNPSLTLQSKLCQKKTNVPLPLVTLTLGSKLKVKVVRIEKRGLIVRFEDGERGFVSMTRCSDNSALTDEDIGKLFPVNSTHQCCLLEYSSLDNMYIASFQQSVINQTVVRIDQLSIGQKVSCELKAWKTTGAIVAVGMAKGFIPKLHFGELTLKNPTVKFPIGSKFKARVLRVDPMKNQMMLTAKKRLIRSELPILATYEDCTYGTAAEGVISRVTKFGINIFTIGGLPAFIPASKATTEERTNLPKLFFPGQVVKFHVLDANKKENRIILSLLFHESKTIPKSERIVEPETQTSAESSSRKRTRQRKNSNSQTVSDSAAIQVNGKNSDLVLEKKVSKQQKVAPKCKDIENETEPPRKKKKKQSELEQLNEKKQSESALSKKNKKQSGAVAKEICLECPGESFYDTSYVEVKEQDSESDVSEDEDIDEQQNKKKQEAKKQSKAGANEKNEDVTKEPVTASEKYAAYSVNDYEKLVLSTPNNGKLWCSYINFVLHSSDIEDARAVAARGIRTVLFREEAEKELIWKLWLSIEATHGTEESLKKVFGEAVKANDPLTMYRAMADIYGVCKNIKEQEHLVYLMTKKFPTTRDVWFCAIDFYYKNGQIDKGRTVFKTALEKLPKTEHILMISKTAVLEIKYGDIDRGRTLLENTLLTYPKRMDLWILYAAQLIKKGQIDAAREVFENAVKVAFVPKKMLSLLKSYLQFEIEHGTVENRDRVQEEAFKYVNTTMPHLAEAFQDVD